MASQALQDHLVASRTHQQPSDSQHQHPWVLPSLRPLFSLLEVEVQLVLQVLQMVLQVFLVVLQSLEVVLQVFLVVLQSLQILVVVVLLRIGHPLT